ncbi:MAG: carboxymuconolactone decarboxylase family protein [Acidimicrobiia bacterium]
MTKVPIHDLETAPIGSREPLSRQSERIGRVINIFGAMANSPVLIEMYDLIETHLAKNSNLDNATRQAIHLTVAAVNDCDYCQAAYTGAAKAAGFDIEETIQIRQGKVEGQPKLTALLTLCRQIADNRGWVDDSVWARAIGAGWTVEEILDAYSDVVRTILTNYFNHLVNTEHDLSEVPPLPT